MSLAVALAAVLAWPGQAELPRASVNPGLIRVHVHTDDDGDARELAGRRQSVADVAAALAAKKKLLTVVGEDDEADLVIDVIERTWTVPKIVIGLGTRPGQPPGVGGAPARAVQLRVSLRLAGRDDPVSFRSRNSPLESSRGWKSAADDLASQMEKWIAERRAAILAAR
jgi:hypothetical protein